MVWHWQNMQEKSGLNTTCINLIKYWEYLKSKIQTTDLQYLLRILRQLVDISATCTIC